MNTMEAQELKCFLNNANRITGRNSFPILNNVYIRNQWLVVSNLDVYYFKKFVDLPPKLECLIDLSILNDITKKIKQGNIDLGTCGKIKTAKGEFRYLSCDPADYPLIPNGKGKFSVRLTDELIKHLKIATKFSASDPLRPVMNSVVFEKKHIVGTDAHCLYFHTHKEKPRFEFMILPVVIHILTKPMDVKLFSEKEYVKYIEFVSDDEKILFRSIEGKYPDWKAVVPKKYKIVVNLHKKELLELIDSASISTPHSGLIRFNYINRGKKKIVISSQDIDRSLDFTGELRNFTSRGSGITIGFRDVFMQKILSILPNDIKIGFVDPSRAMMINDVALLMPMMLEP